MRENGGERKEDPKERLSPDGKKARRPTTEAPKCHCTGSVCGQRIRSRSSSDLDNRPKCLLEKTHNDCPLRDDGGAGNLRPSIESAPPPPSLTSFRLPNAEPRDTPPQLCVRVKRERDPGKRGGLQGARRATERGTLNSATRAKLAGRGAVVKGVSAMLHRFGY